MFQGPLYSYELLLAGFVEGAFQDESGSMIEDRHYWIDPVSHDVALVESETGLVYFYGTLQANFGYQPDGKWAIYVADMELIL